MNSSKIIVSSLVILFIGSYLLFSIEEEQNIALNKQAIGTVENLKNLTDGVVDLGNYAEFKNFEKMEQYFIIVLGQARYIKSIKLYWVKGYEPASYKVETSKSLFSWEGTEVYSFKTVSEKNGLLITEHKLNNRAAFFIRVVVLKPKSTSVRASEVELLPEISIKLKIDDQQVKNITENSVDIVYTTSIPSTGYLRFGDGENNLNQNVGMEMDVYSEHVIHIGNLLKGTAYYFQPVTRDLNGNLVIGKITPFKTLGIPLPLYLGIGVQKIQPFSVELKWALNVPCKTELFLSTSKENLKSYFKNDQLLNEYAVAINKLVPETIFYYRLISIDKFNNKIEQSGEFTTGVDNIALGKKAFGSFYYFPDTDGATSDFRLFGRITDGYYELDGHCSSGDANQADQVAIVDLGEKFKINSVKVIWRAIAYSRNFEVFLSSDMKNWDPVKNKIDAKENGIRIASAGNQGLMLRSVSVSAGGKQARYVKINIPKGSKVGSDLPFIPSPYLQLTEIEVFKVPDYGPPQYIINRIK